MKKGNKRILSSSLSELVTRFSQQNIIAEIEKRYQSAPAKLIPISLIDDNSFIAKVRLPDETMDFCASRLKEKGFYNPLVVRTKEDGHYEIILGRKRLFGARRAGMLTLPCAFAEVSDEEVLLMLLADTRDQREANVVEMALLCHELQSRFHYNQQTLADVSHQSRCQISNILRILKLPEELQEAICLGKLSYGHGRALASLSKQDAEILGKRALEENLSVRQIESLAKQQKGQSEPMGNPVEIAETETELVIRFGSREELEAFRKKKQI